MRILLFILLLFTIGSLTSCKQKKQDISLDAPDETITFSSYKEQLFKTLPAQYTIRRKYINLEMNKDKGYVDMISKLSIINGKIYILDKRKKSLAVYQLNGSYIGGITKAQKDYVNIADFDVDDKGVIYMIDGNLDNNLRYNSKFELISKGKSLFEVDVIQNLSNDNFLFGLSSWNAHEESGEKIIVGDKNYKKIKNVASYDEFVDDDFWITDYRFVKTDEAIFYNRPIDNNVYIFSLDGNLKRKYLFDFGSMNVPDQDKKEVQNNLPKFEKYRLLTDFSIVDKNLAFGKIWDKKESRFFFLDRINKIAYLEDLSSPNELKHIIDYTGHDLISFIYPGEYNSKFFQNLPEESKEHLEKGGIVICDYQLRD